MDENKVPTMDEVRFSPTKHSKYKYKRDFRRTQTATTELHAHSVDPATKPSAWVRDWEAAEQLRNYSAENDQEG
jgi:hypothetical protein